MEWNQKAAEQPGDESKIGDAKSHMIVVTDACLPLLASGESAIPARVLINYELPTKKVEFSNFSCQYFYMLELQRAFVQSSLTGKYTQTLCCLLLTAFSIIRFLISSSVC